MADWDLDRMMKRRACPPPQALEPDWRLDTKQVLLSATSQVNGYS